MSKRLRYKRPVRFPSEFYSFVADFTNGTQPGCRSLTSHLRLGASKFAFAALAAVASPVGVWAQDASVSANNIVTDGRTMTTVSVNGNQTGITTSTIVKNTGYNSFLNFEQVADTTVNLYLPDATSNLVNIVRDGPVVIDGILNSYKDGQIGGNVFFSDSHGFIVGQSGVVNVGSLTVNTPTDQFLDSVIGADGTINEIAASKLMRGEIPISADGSIIISGQINAQNGITLDGQNVTLTGANSTQVTADELTQRQRFQATVNATGLVEGGAMVSSNGVISIVAAGSASVSGRVNVGADTNGRGGSINVTSGVDITLAPTAELSANGEGASGIGGTIVVYAGSSLFAQTGAMVSAHGAGTGAGGFIELSGKYVEIGSVNIDLMSDFGLGGTFLIDPDDVNITAASSILNAGVNTQILANNSITIENGGSIDTTLLGGVSGDITLTAPTINVANGGILNASAVGGGTAGTVSLIATKGNGGTAQITVAGEITGGDVNLIATATAAPLTIIASLPTADASVVINGGKIVVSGALAVTATASTAAVAASLPVGVVVTNVTAAVDVMGNAIIEAASADLSSSATAVSIIATQSLAPANSSVDGAVAVSTVNSSATTHIGDAAELTITDNVSLSATNTVISHADAIPIAVAFGASVAVSVVTATTAATIDGMGYISANSLSLDTTTATDIVANASAAAGGATAPHAGSEASNYLNDAKYQSAASTSEGQVSVVGAFALSDLTSTTTATVNSGKASDITGIASINTLTSNTVNVTADGSALDSDVGVGVAVGINLAKVQNNATLAGQGISAGSLAVTARMNSAAAGTNSFITNATSGAGGTSVGVAGSLAVNLIDTQSLATISATAPVGINGGSITISAEDESVSTATAVPDTTGATGDVGVGASVAINIVANRTTAIVSNGTSITTPGSVTLSADSVHAITTTAEAGSSGGISITPALALSLVNNVTTAQLGTGTTAQQSAGDINILASQQATETTTASGAAAGSDAAIGAAVSIALIDDTVSATTLRDLNAANDITLRSWGASLSTLEATASASGSEAADSSGDAQAGQDSDVDGTVTSNLTHASDQQNTAGVGDIDQQTASSDGAAADSGRSASTGEGKVTVAAAVGVNVQNATVSAGVPDGRSITAGGALIVATSSNITGAITTDGSAAGENPAAVGIGAAVSVNVVHAKNDATIGNSSVNADSVNVTAIKLDVAKLVAGVSADAVGDTYLSSAKSGAGGSNVGLAGSLALNLVDTQSQATIAGGATVTLVGGDLLLNSDNQTSTTASALPDETGAAGGDVGIGASVAINILGNRSTANLGDEAVLTGVDEVTLSASAIHEITTEAEAGSEGGVSITPVVALSMINNTTTASLGTLAAGMTSTGAVTISAIQQATTTTTAKGQAAGGTAAIGAALALNLVNDKVIATTNRDITAGGDVTLSAAGASLGTLLAEASASGGAPADDNGDAEAGQDDTVDDTVDGQFSSAQSQQTASGVGDDDQQGETGSAASEDHSAETSEGKVTVAAAVAVNIQKSTVSASVQNTVNISSPTGTLNILTASNTDASVTTNASAVGEEGAQAQVGIGAAVSVNVVRSANDATLGAGTHDVNGVNISANKLDVAALASNPASTATRSDTYLSSATSGAGGTKVGIAGSLGMNIVDTHSVASIADGASVTLSGDVTISADNQTKTTATALPVEGTAGGTVGIGASAAINILGNRAIAKIGNNVTLTNANNLTVSASAVHDITTKAEAGASGGVSIVPVLALALVTNTASATIGSNASTLVVNNTVKVTVEQDATETTNASATAAGDKVAVGIALSLALVTDKVVVSTDRSITATEGNVTFSASGISTGSLTVTAGAAGAAEADENDESTDGGGDVDTKVSDQFGFASKIQTDSNVGDTEQKSDTTATSGQDHSAGTSEGKLSVAAAVGVNVVTSSVSAKMTDGKDITAGGHLTVIAANGTSGSVTSDASASGTQVSIGAAASVNAITSTNTARLGAATYTANGVTVSALKATPPNTPHVDSFITSAKSGAGGTKVGIAGALALNLINSSSVAAISSTSIVNAGTGASIISADQQMIATASAAPLDDSATSGGKVGIGASVALNLITSTSTAQIEDGAIFNNGAGISVLANSDVSTVTVAKAGSEGGIAIDAVVALALLDITTTARIGTGNAIETAGAVTITATGAGENTATGTGEAAGGKVGVGAAVAVIAGGGDRSTDILDTSVTSAVLARDLTASALTISASSARSYEAYATASSGGGKDMTDQEAADSKSESTNNLEENKNYQQGTGTPDQNAEGTSGTKGGNKVAVAAAVGVAAAQDLVSATLEDVTVTLTNDLIISATNDVDIMTRGDGTASGAKVGVAVGVALSISNNTANASIADGATIASAGVITVNADTSKNMSHEVGKTDFLNGLSAIAFAGASSSKVSVAGALAVDVSNMTASATIGDNVTIGNVSRVGAVNVTADNSSRMSAKATSYAVSTGKVGVGASIAVIVSENEYEANVGAGTSIRSEGVTVSAANAKIDPTETFSFTDLESFQGDVVNKPLFSTGNYYTEAIGGSGSPKVAVQGSFAVMVFSDTMSAAVGKSLNSPAITAVTSVDSNGKNVTVSASNAVAARALSGAVALSGKVGVGVSSSVIVNESNTTAELGTNARLTAAGLVKIDADGSQEIDVISVSAAGASTVGVAGVASVLISKNDVQALVGSGAQIAATGNVSITADNDFDNLSVAGGLGVGNSAGIGAAAIVVTVNNITRAALADGTSTANGVSISDVGALNIAANATESGDAYAVAGGAAPGSVGVGAGAAIFIIDTTTEALVGNFAEIGQSSAAGDVSITAQDDTTLFTFPGAAGLGGSVGAGAAVGVGIITKTVSAKIGSDAKATGSDVLVEALSGEAVNVIAVSAGVGGSAGLAGAVAVYTIENNTTSSIGARAEVFAARNVAVLANDFASVDSLVGSVGAGGSAGIGASVGIVIIDNKTYASVADGAKVTALGAGTGVDYVSDFNVTFSALSDSFKGAGLPDWDASGGLTASNATANNADSKVGLTASDARDVGLSLLTKTRNSETFTQTANGVVVNAAASNSIRSLEIGFGGGGSAAIALSGNVPVITADTRATIGAAQINKMAGVADARQSIIVAATSDIYNMGIAGAAAIGGGVGAGAGVTVTVVENTTKATVATGADMKAERDVNVTALSKADFVSFSAAAAGGGSVALAGGVGVVSLTSTTTAQLGGKTVAGGNVEVLADDQTRVASMAGSVSVGLGVAGVGGAISVLSIDKTTTAEILANANVTALGKDGTLSGYTGADMNSTTAVRGINIAATSGESNLTIAASAAGGLYAGISGVVTVQMHDINTSAKIGANALINQDASQPGAHADQDVVVTARDTSISNVYAGGLAVGFVGLAGTIDVGVIKTTTTAVIADGVNLTAKRNVRVNALSNKAGNSVIVAGAAGLVSIGAAIAIYDYGNGIDPNGESKSQMSDASDGEFTLDDITGQASGQTNDEDGDGVSSLFEDAGTDQRIKTASSRAQTARELITLETDGTGLLVPAGTSANIGNATIIAGNEIGVRSYDKLTTTFTAGAAAAGIAGVGAGIVVQSVDTTNTAQLSGAATVSSAALAINAHTIHSLTADTIVGAAGGFGLAAAVTYIEDNSDTYAYINGATVSVSGGVAVNAISARTIDADATGVSLGLTGAAGVSYAETSIGGETKAALGSDASGATSNQGVNIGTSGNRTGSVTLGATSTDSVLAETIAAGGGIGFAIQGAVADGDVVTTVATEMNNANIYTANAINSMASSNSAATTDSTGVSISGGLAAGVSLAESKLDVTVSNNVLGGSVLDGGSVSIGSEITRGRNDSDALAAAGALVGVAGSDAESDNTSSAITTVSGSTINSGGQVSITAATSTEQTSKSSGLAIGLIAAGSNNALSKSNTETITAVTNMNGITAGGLNITSTGDDKNYSTAVAGSGGLVAGAASSSDTSTTSRTEAYATTTGGAGNKYVIDVSTGLVDINATHTANFGGTVDSTQASLVGASGADLDHQVRTTVIAELGDHASVRASNLTIEAANNVFNRFRNSSGAIVGYESAEWNVNSGSGGLLNLPAGKANVNIVQNTEANVGNNADIRLLALGAGVSDLRIEAFNDVITEQKAKLDSGGAIATAKSVVELAAIQNATVNIGSNSTLLVDLGNINVGAWNNARMEGRASATTYGIAGAPDGHSWANLGVANIVNIGTDTRIEASNGYAPADGSLPRQATVNIFAGRSPESGDRFTKESVASNVNIKTTIDLFNNSAIPIPGSPDARANVIINASVNQGTTDNTNVSDTVPLIGVLAAGDITIGAERGDITLSAVGFGTDIYRQALAAAASAVSEAFGGDEVTFDYHGGTTSNTGVGRVDLHGLVATGLQKYKSLTLDYGQGCTPTLVSCIVVSGTIGEDGITRSSITPDNSIIIQRLRQLELLIANTDGDTVAKGAYQNEINFLRQKLAALGLGSFDGSGNFSLAPYTSGLSPQQVLLAQKAETEVQLSGVTTGFTNQATVADSSLSGSIAGAYNNGSANDHESYVTAVRSAAASLTSYTSAVTTINTTPATIQVSDGNGGFNTVNNPALLVAPYTTAVTLVNTYNGYNSTISTNRTQANGFRTTINTNIAANTTLQSEINGLISIINAPGSTSAQVSTAQTQITSKLNAIVTNNTAIKTATNNLNSRMGTINTALVNLTTTANGGTAIVKDPLASFGSLSYNLVAVDRAKTFVNDWDVALGTVNSTISTRVTTLVGSTPPVGGYTVGSFTTIASALASSIPTQTEINNASTTPAAAPTIPLIEVDDVAARLGNIYLSGNVVTGGSTGILSAPGNAEINITNNTAATLKVNNITMPSYDAGHVRVNGVLVDSIDDVASFAPGQPTSTKFAQVITGLTSSRPIVTLTNNYNPTDIAFPLGLAPPDLIVDGVINNIEGTVDLTSEYGNIFVYGAINAGSVNIVAKNGDFVSSYVNGFNHIGGDPASFNSPINSAEAGIGIIANGAISISARYLNINSTIQSGIVDLSLNLSAIPTLTALNPMDIGVYESAITIAFTTYRNSLTAGNSPSETTQVPNVYGESFTLNFNPTGLNTTELKAAITEYKAAIVLDPSANPMYVIPVTTGGERQLINIKDYLSGTGITPRLEFAVSDANTYKSDSGANGLAYQVVRSLTDDIGASYDVDNAQYVVNGAEVHGGYIQLYGQILNTSSTGGELNVLDGFGRINITNSSSIPLVLQTIDAGSDTTDVFGRGTAGVIDITDITNVVSPDGDAPSQVSVKRTVYKRDYVPGNSTGAIQIATQTGMLSTTTGLPSYSGTALVFSADGSTSSDGNDRNASYITTSNLRYIWTTATEYRLQTTVTTKDRQLFGSSALSIDFDTNFNSIGAPNVLSAVRVADGTYLSQVNTPTGTTTFINDGSGNPAILVTSPTNYVETPNTDSLVAPYQLVEGDFSFSDPRSSYTQTGQSSRSCNWWTLCIDSSVTTTYLLDQYYTTIKTSSLKADNPIGINFIGYNTAKVEVTSPSNVTLNGQVSARNGDVLIAATGSGHSIISNDPGALITGRRISLEAGASVGASSGAAVQLRMDGVASGNGALIATAGAGNVNLNAPNGVVVQKVTAAGNPEADNGNVNITVGTDIKSAQVGQFFTPTTDTAPLIQAPRVRLVAGNGDVGSIANPLMVNTGYSLGSRFFGNNVDPDPYYGLTVLASGDIGISSASWGNTSQAWTGNEDGTMLVDQVVSLGGDILLRTTGQILDNNPIEAVDTRTYAELLGYWNSLGLVEGTTENAEKVAFVKATFEQGRNVDYQTYWKMRSTQADGGETYNPAFDFELDELSDMYQALLRVGADIASYEQEQTNIYHALHATVGDLTQTYEAGYGGLPDYDDYWAIRQTQSDRGEVYDSNHQYTVDPDSALYQRLVAANINVATYEADQTARYHALNAEVGTLTTTYVSGYQGKAHYDDYWQMRQSQPDSGATYNPTFEVTLNTDSRTYQTLVEQGVDIGAYEDQLTDRYHALHNEVGGLTATYDTGYRYVLADNPDDEAALLNRSSYTENQLVFKLSPGALKTITGTNPVIKAPNVKGRTVTLEAGVGIGETLNRDPNVANSGGIDIPGGLAPSALTDAQKIALARAERPDLLIIVGAIGGLPVGATQEQTDAYNDAVNAGVLIGPTTVYLGKNESEMTAGERAVLQAAASGLVDAKELTIKVLSKRPLNFEANEALNVVVTGVPTAGLDTGSAFLASRGNGLLNSISVAGETRIQAVGPIANVGTGIVQTGNLILESAQGGIGSGLNPLNLNAPVFGPLQISLHDGASLIGRAQGDIDLDMAGTANIDTIYSPGDVTVAGETGILNANDDDLINILGRVVTLTAEAGDIGAAERTLNVGVNFGGGITAAAPAGAIYVSGTRVAKFVVTSALAPNAISLLSKTDVVINGPVTTDGQVILNSIGKTSITDRGVVTSNLGNIDVTVGSIQMFDGATLVSQAGTVDVTTTLGDAVLTGVSAFGDVTIDVVDRVFAGTTPLRDYDIETTSQDAVVMVIAGLGIGDKTMPNTVSLDWPFDVDNAMGPVTDVANPLIIKTGKIDLEATTGDVNVITPLAIAEAQLNAVAGSIDIAAAAAFHTQSSTSGQDVIVVSVGDLTADALSGGTSSSGLVNLISTAGALNVGTSTSSGTQTMNALNDVTFTQITTTGALPTDPGNVDGTSTNGAIIGGSIDATGTVQLTGNGIGFDTINAGVDAILVSSKDIIGDTLEAANHADLTAGSETYLGDIAINNVSAKTMSFDAKGELKLPDLNVAESVILRGGTITGEITQVPSGPNPLQLTLAGGRGAVGTRATVSVDAPAGLEIGDLFFVDTLLDTTAENVSIANAFVPGSLRLMSPLQTLLFDNRSPLPQYNANVQFYEQSLAFDLDLQGFASTSNAFVVQYNVSADSTEEADLLEFPGAGLVRDTIRTMRSAVDWGHEPGTLLWGLDLSVDEVDIVYEDDDVIFIDDVAYFVGSVRGQGPAVKLGEQ